MNLSLKSGFNKVEVSTDLSCQGSYQKEIYIAPNSMLFPNPVKDVAYLLIGGTSKNIQYIIYDVQGNVVKDKSIISSSKCKKAIIQASKLIKNHGRMLVRKSGTEPKIRIMGESENKFLLLKWLNNCTRLFKSHNLA